MRYIGGDPIAHLEADLKETEYMAEHDINGSRDWHNARATGLRHALKVIRGEVG